MNIIPVIEKIIEKDALFYGVNKSDEIIFVTDSQEIANMYYAIPSIIERQAEIIDDLTVKLNSITHEYNAVVFQMIPSSSRSMH